MRNFILIVFLILSNSAQGYLIDVNDPRLKREHEQEQKAPDHVDNHPKTPHSGLPHRREHSQDRDSNEHRSKDHSREPHFQSPDPQIPITQRSQNRHHHTHDFPHHHYYFYDHRYNEPYVFVDPLITIPQENEYAIEAHGDTYYYYQGTFYQLQDDQYIAVPPPLGAEVRKIPAEHLRLAINGTTYYVANSIFYIRNAGEYTVAEPPDLNSRRSLFVDVPNKNGGYTSIKLAKSGRGFIGPQGEYYEDFPSFDQLQVMYAQ